MIDKNEVQNCTKRDFFEENGLKIFIGQV